MNLTVASCRAPRLSADGIESRPDPLLAFGRTPLFFYVVHIYLYGLLGLAYPGNTSLAGMYPFWLLGLVLLYPACLRYQKFKNQTQADSIWRLF